MLRRILPPLLSPYVLRAVPILSASAAPSFSFSFSSSSRKPCPPGEDESIENNQGSPTRTISVDRSGLYNPPVHFHNTSVDTGMVKHLKSIIKFRGGPISIAEYMEEVLTNPNYGFYINRDVFGVAGDFVTSPEVSQMFGEMVGVWTMCLWEQLGQPVKVNLVELGPGRGTLMADLLRGSSKFAGFAKSTHVHLVECSPTLQKLQYNTLKCIDEAISGDDTATKTTTTLTGAPIFWHADLEGVPSGVPTIIIAHEFYDALPIHQFQKSSRGWCEKMIDISEDSSGFRFVLSPQPTPASLLYLRKLGQWVDKNEIAKLEQIEVCPRALELTHKIAKRINIDGGGALIIDYGKNEIISDSLQGRSIYHLSKAFNIAASKLEIIGYADSKNESTTSDAVAVKEAIDIKELKRVDHILASIQRKLPAAPAPPPFPDGYAPPASEAEDKCPEDLQNLEARLPQIDPIIDQGPVKRMRFQ